MNLQLDGKRALVVGASRGIGRAVARCLALEGCAVAIGARNPGRIADAVDAIGEEVSAQIIGVSVDTLDAASVRHMVDDVAERLGGIDILVNSAARVGGAVPEDVDSVDEQQMLVDFDEKTVGYLRCCRAVVPHMRENGWGRIINIAGLAAIRPGAATSTASRNAAVVALTRSLAYQLGPSGIAVNAIHPGPTVTERTMDRFEAKADEHDTTLEAVMEREAGATRLGLLVTADDVAASVVFLSSPVARGINGEEIAVTSI